MRTENRYDDPEMWGGRYQEFDLGAIGTGVAIGDYDGDGRPDLFVVSKTESCRLFRNLGGWRFEDVTEKAGVGDHGAAARIWKQGATFVDVNNDGRLDIYVCRFNAPNLLYINQGDGTFKEMAHAYGLDVTDACVMAAFCDYDRDGWLDVYIPTNVLDSARHPDGQRGLSLPQQPRRHVHQRDGPRRHRAARRRAHSATWWDFDNDGWPDLYVANDFGVPDKLYHNNRDGTFTDVIDQRGAAHAVLLDGLGPRRREQRRPDRFPGRGHGGDDAREGPAQRWPTRAARTARSAGGLAPRRRKYRRSALYLNTGTGRCLEAAFLAGVAATDWTWSPRFEDLDNDGRLDLFVTNGMYRETTNHDMIARMMTAESAGGADPDHARAARCSPRRHLAFRNLGDLQFRRRRRRLGARPEGSELRLGVRRPRRRRRPRPRLRELPRRRHAAAQRQRHRSPGDHRSARDRVQPLRRRRDGAHRDARPGVQVRQLWLARGYMSSSEPIVHFGLGARHGHPDA